MCPGSSLRATDEVCLYDHAESSVFHAFAAEGFRVQRLVPSSRPVRVTMPDDVRLATSIIVAVRIRSRLHVQKTNDFPQRRCRNGEMLAADCRACR